MFRQAVDLDSEVEAKGHARPDQDAERRKIDYVKLHPTSPLLSWMSVLCLTEGHHVLTDPAEALTEPANWVSDGKLTAILRRGLAHPSLKRATERALF